MTGKKKRHRKSSSDTEGNTKIKKMAKLVEQPSLKDIMDSIESSKVEIQNDIVKLKEEIKSDFDKMKSDFGVKIKEVNVKYEGLDKRVTNLEEVSGVSLARIVIKQLPEEEGETDVLLYAIVDELLNELGVNTDIVSAERMSNGPGRIKPVLVEVRSIDDIKNIMINKSKLKNSEQFSGIYIENEKSRNERIQEANYRKIVQNIPHLQIRRGRIVNKPTPDNSD